MGRARWRCAVIALGCAMLGCHTVFDLDRIEGCPVVGVGAAQADDDRDLIANGSDNCPSAVNADQHDEDLDGFGDACDLCPMGVESRDADCDGIGTSCDADDTRPDVRLFHGFGSSNGIDLSTGMNRATIADDALQMRYAINTVDSYFGWGLVTTPVAFDGVYETQFTWTKADTYFSVQLRFGIPPNATPRTGYLVDVIASGSSDRIGVRSFDGGASTPIIEIPIARVTPGTYTLRLRVQAGRVRAELVGDNAVTGEVEADTPALADEGLFELRAHFVDIDFAYASHVSALP